MTVREDPIKMHKEANSLMENGKYEEAETSLSKLASFTIKDRTISARQK